MGRNNRISVNHKEDENIRKLILGCTRGERVSQKLLYENFFGYALSICLRYSKRKEEAYEILNDGFMKVFIHLKEKDFDSERPFKGWLRKIMINTALDHYRKNLKHYHHQDLNGQINEASTENILQDLAYEDLISMIQDLPPSYQVVFNLAIIDGYKHEEISTILGISVGTSKSNLFKAREKLKFMIIQKRKEEYAKFS